MPIATLGIFLNAILPFSFFHFPNGHSAPVTVSLTESLDLGFLLQPHLLQYPIESVLSRTLPSHFKHSFFLSSNTFEETVPCRIADNSNLKYVKTIFQKDGFTIFLGDGVGNTIFGGVFSLKN